MTEEQKIKACISTSLPNLKNPLLEKIESLHLKNKQTALKGQNKNKQIVQAHILKKIAYHNTIMKKRQEKVNKAHQTLQQKRKLKERVNEQHYNKANQNINNIESKNQSKIQKHMQKLSLRMQKAQQNRKKFTQIQKGQKLSSSHVTSQLQKLSLLQQSMEGNNSNDKLSCSQSRSDQKRIIASMRRQQIKKQQMKKCQDLLNSSIIKHQQAKQRRNSLKTLRQAGILQQKITQAQKNAKKVQENKINSIIFKSLNKYTRFNTKTSEITNSQNNAAQQRKKMNMKQHQKVILKRQDLNQIANKRKQQQLAKKYNKIENVQNKKQSLLAQFRQTLHQRLQSKKLKLNDKIKQLQIQQRKKAEEQLNKEKQSWMFLTSLKQQKDRLISKNMYQSAQLRVLRG